MTHEGLGSTGKRGGGDTTQKRRKGSEETTNAMYRYDTQSLLDSARGIVYTITEKEEYLFIYV